jgi:hypothetical protein
VFRAHGEPRETFNFTQRVIGDTTIGPYHYFILQRSSDFRKRMHNAPKFDTGTIFIERSDSARLYRHVDGLADDFVLADLGDSVGALAPQYPGLLGLPAHVLSKGDSLIAGQPHLTISIVYTYIDSSAASPFSRPWWVFFSAGLGHFRFYSDYYDYLFNASLVGAVIEGVVVGDTLLTDVTTPDGKEIPAEFSLSQNYPNPFNPTTRIGFGVSGLGARVKLAVYDLLGREVAVLMDERSEPGRFEVQFDASGLASGVYYYRLCAGSFVATKKMLLVR